MKSKKDNQNNSEKAEAAAAEPAQALSTKEDLKVFLLNVRDKMMDEQAAAVYAMSALNYVLTVDNVYGLLDNENKELARDIWLRLKQSGLQLKNPPLLFGEEGGSTNDTGA